MPGENHLRHVAGRETMIREALCPDVRVPSTGVYIKIHVTLIVYNTKAGGLHTGQNTTSDSSAPTTLDADRSQA